MIQRGQLVEWLNSIKWLGPTQVTPNAEVLIEEHLGKIRRVIKELMAKKGAGGLWKHMALPKQRGMGLQK